MSYLVFARKYRPLSFDDIVAQEHVTRTLQNGIKNDRIGQGYLLCGPRGTGKTTSARVLAKAINCAKGPTPEPCGECPACIEITAGTSFDVLEIDAASNTGVDDVRTLRENVRYLPTSGHKRIYIIDEVHRLSPSAFDALLKTLEEPPPHVMFIFATTEPLKVPETILSRTQRFDFKLVSVNDLAGHLKNIADKEKLNISESALRLVARKASGSVRDSLSLLDQIAAYATDSITDEIVVEALGLVGKQLLFDYANSIATKDKIAALKVVKTIIDSGIDAKDFVGELLEHLRILLILATDKNSAPILNIGEDEVTEYTEQAEHFSVGDLIRLMKISSDLHSDLKFSGLDERLLLEMNAIKMAEIESTVKFEEILDLLKQPANINSISSNQTNPAEKKKHNLNAERPTFTKPQEKPKTTPAPPQPSQSHSNSIDQPTVKNGWKQFLNDFGLKRPMLSAQLGMVIIGEVNNNRIHLGYPTTYENAKQIVEKTDNLNIITNALKDYFKAELSVGFYIDANITGASISGEPQQTPEQQTEELVARSPRIKKLIEKVEGQIIGVKKVK